MKDMKKSVLILTVFLLLWGGWFACYPYFMKWLEGFSFFSTVPDFFSVHFQFPADIFRYVGAFLLQFFTYPAAGAAIQALLPILGVLSVWATVKMIFKDPDSLFWIPFLIVPVIVNSQLDDLTLVKTLQILVLLACIVLAVLLIRLFVKFSLDLPGFMRKTWLVIAISVLSAGLSLYVLQKGPLSSHHEAVARLTYWGEHKQWDKILKEVSRQDALTNEYKRRYVLLALSETDRLPDYAFRYGLSSSNDFHFQNPDGPLALKLNILFYRALGLHNPVIYYAYQQALTSGSGLSFDAMRTLADAYLELKDYELAKKYLDILDHSLCNRKWVQDRIQKLETIKDSSPEYHMTGSRFVLKDFYKDISAMATRYPDNKKYADYLLCGLLADKSGNRFFSVFDMVAGTHYKDTRTMPLLYQEALCLIAGYEPEVLEKYPVDERIIARFDDFSKLVRSGKVSQAKRKYADTYWAYVY